MGPKEGFWKLGIESDIILPCPVLGTCLGYKDREDFYHSGDCAYPYTGNLC